MKTTSLFTRHIGILQRHTTAEMSKRLEPLGIGPGQYIYIIIVCKNPGIPQDHLTEQTMYNKSSVARAIAQLEAGGFITRETAPADKRSYRLYPTEKGRAALPVILGAAEEYIDALTACLDNEEVEIMMRALAILADSVSVSRHKHTRNGRPKETEDKN